MKEQIANFLDIDIEDIKELTAKQKKALRGYTSNLFNMPKYYTDDCIIFTSEDAMKHWQYYAGFEYLDSPDIQKKGDSFIAAYSTYNDTDNRIAGYLEVIEENEE